MRPRPVRGRAPDPKPDRAPDRRAKSLSVRIIVKGSDPMARNWLRKLLKDVFSRKAPAHSPRGRNARWFCLERLEDRLAPGVVLLYGGPGQPLLLAETNQAAGIAVTIS